MNEFSKPKPSATGRNDWLTVTFEQTPDHTWALTVDYGRNGTRKFYRKWESMNFQHLFKR
ncbi:MAG: hypothetical protein VKK42_25985 [Lyngbya sp.]|nr:hypothetical protein [Lyngbya sp.]